MKIDIAKILSLNGPMASSKVKEKLLEQGISETAARQRLSRSKGDVLRFYSFSLPKGEKFLYLPKHYKTEEFWQNLISAHESGNTIYAHIYFASKPYRGVFPSYLLGKISGAPVNLLGHIPIARLEDEIKKSEFFTAEMIGDRDEYLVSHDSLAEFLKNKINVRGQLLVEEVIIKGVSEWLRKNGMVSYNNIRVRSDKGMPDFSNHHWDISGPSYLMPIAQMGVEGVRNGFVVADVAYGEIDTKAFKAYLAKVNRCRNQKRCRPFVAMYIASSFDSKVINLARQNGIMLTSVSNFLGSYLSELLDDLIRTLNRSAKIAAVNPEKINELLNGLSKIEGASINLRGVLFEMLVCHLVLKTQNVSSADMNKVFGYGVDSAEVDVIGYRNETEIKCYECKGYSSNNKITSNMIENWIERVKRIRKYCKDSNYYNNRKMVFSYWTSSDFDEGAIKLLEEFKDKNKKINVEWKNGKQIRLLASEERFTSIVRTLDEHYLKNPLSKEWDTNGF